MFDRLEGSTDIQDKSMRLAAKAALSRAEGRLEEALAAGAATIETAATLSPSFQRVKQGLVDALEAALALGDTRKAEELLAWIEELAPATRPPYLDAQALRFRARLNGDAAGLATAAARFSALGVPFWLAITQLEQAETLGDAQEAKPLRTEARATFERLGTTPWLDRAGGVVETGVAV